MSKLDHYQGVIKKASDGIDNTTRAIEELVNMVKQPFAAQPPQSGEPSFIIPQAEYNEMQMMLKSSAELIARQDAELRSAKKKSKGTTSDFGRGKSTGFTAQARDQLDGQGDEELDASDEDELARSPLRVPPTSSHFTRNLTVTALGPQAPLSAAATTDHDSDLEDHDNRGSFAARCAPRSRSSSLGGELNPLERLFAIANYEQRKVVNKKYDPSSDKIINEKLNQAAAKLAKSINKLAADSESRDEDGPRLLAMSPEAAGEDTVYYGDGKNGVNVTFKNGKISYKFDGSFHGTIAIEDPNNSGCFDTLYIVNSKIVNIVQSAPPANEEHPAYNELNKFFLEHEGKGEGDNRSYELQDVYSRKSVYVNENIKKLSTSEKTWVQTVGEPKSSHTSVPSRMSAGMSHTEANLQRSQTADRESGTGMSH
jgi:hypothetical protein